MKNLRLFIQLSRPLYILSAILLYLLGISIAHYLNGQTDWTALIVGMVWVVLVLLSSQYLNEYFESPVVDNPPTWKHTPFSGSTGVIGTDRISRQAALWAGLTCLAIAASFTVLILQFVGLGSTVLFLISIFLIGELLLALPPVRLISSGYGELLTSILSVAVVPALAFTMQGHDFHRLLIMVAFPLTTLHLAMLLAVELPDYASDLKQGKRPLLVRIGWQRGMLLHNLLILLSYVILGAAFALGLPFRIGWPVVFVLPIAIFQIWLMNRIADGAKPNWSLLILISVSTFALTAYIFTYAFWTH